jgi:hypothetical protein
MSDTPPDAPPAEPAESAKIDFERADFAEPAGEHVECGLCKRAITTEYWQYRGNIFCDSCREVVGRSAADARRGATFGKAFLLGGGAALGCGIGYAIFVGLSHFQFALVTIGIGWAVGRTIQRVTRGFGGQRHQVLAVALTYFASTMGYLPGLLNALGDGGQHTEPSAAATIAVFSMLLMLAAPFLEIADGFNGLLGLLIIFFGLRTAWQVSKGVEVTITGPHKVAAAAGP